jgi:hypothetical protein
MRDTSLTLENTPLTSVSALWDAHRPDYAATKWPPPASLQRTFSRHPLILRTERKAPRRTQKPAAERHCDIYDTMGHDARAHRNREPKKKFTQEDLGEKGLA